MIAKRRFAIYHEQFPQSFRFYPSQARRLTIAQQGESLQAPASSQIEGAKKIERKMPLSLRLQR